MVGLFVRHQRLQLDKLFEFLVKNKVVTVLLQSFVKTLRENNFWFGSLFLLFLGFFIKLNVYQGLKVILNREKCHTPQRGFWFRFFKCLIQRLFQIIKFVEVSKFQVSLFLILFFVLRSWSIINLFLSGKSRVNFQNNINRISSSRKNKCFFLGLRVIYQLNESIKSIRVNMYFRVRILFRGFGLGFFLHLCESFFLSSPKVNTKLK